MAWGQARRQPSDYIERHKKARVIAAHGGVCWICGHEGATEVDHVVPWAEWCDDTLSVHDQTNLAPAHAEPCATCGRDCHADKSKAESARGRARYVAAWKAKGKRTPEPHPGGIPPA